MQQGVEVPEQVPEAKELHAAPLQAKVLRRVLPALRRGLQQAVAVREPQMPSAVPRWAVLPLL